MDVIIQIIVIIVIISSVLKQIKKVSDKSQNLGKPKLPGQDYDEGDTEKQQERTVIKPSAAPYPAEPVLSQPEPLAFPVTNIEQEEAAAESEWEVHRIDEPEVRSEMDSPSLIDTAVLDQTGSVEPEPLIPDGTDAEMPSGLMPSTASTKSLPAPPVSLIPGFSAREVTQGIIMREILGPPVSLREGESL